MPPNLELRRAGEPELADLECGNEDAAVELQVSPDHVDTESASRTLWVNLMFLTGPTIRPSSTRNVPSRVIPVMVAVMRCATLV